ncbi:amidohydrolase family protein [Cellulomonas sp. P24]|uniref:amidohydrolase n=1 Tax=Cellulomonas sp. P24 TaxID=2885206 RepID=UPI00287065BF|nr:amidohydrolase family protein [Cellulomonas sp. P24]MCR6493082.1 amidohydrolase family protein [Cellulomonas sp. P24]
MDLDGRPVVPGLWDNHVHFTQWALARQRLDVSGTTSAAEVVRLVVERLRTQPLPDGATLTGLGFRDALWSDTPSAVLLDDAIAAAGLPPVPVVLMSGDLHCGWLNTAALRSPALAAHGLGDHPTGVLREAEWFAASEDVSVVAPDVLERLVDEAARAAAARGVVGVMDVEIADNLSVWSRRVQSGITSLRVSAGVWPEHLDRAIARELATGDVLPGTDGLVTMGPLKIIADGSLNTRTAYCHDPYPGLTGPEARGVLTYDLDRLVPLMTQAARHGIACAIHAIGDRANTVVLDAFEKSGARGSVEHAQLVSPEDVPRFAALGVVASVQPEHAMDDRDVVDRYWADRVDRAYPYRDLLESGAQLALGSDAPVAPLDPWISIAAAVTRARDDRTPWHLEQALPIGAALAASVRSSVAPGQLADLAILDADPTTTDAATLRTMPVAATLLGGRVTWGTLGSR